MKYLEVDLTKEVKDLYKENYKMVEEIEERCRLIESYPTLWMGRIDIVKMAMPLKVITDSVHSL